MTKTSKTTRTVLLLALAAACALLTGAARREVTYKTETGILYREGDLDDYAREKCRLDVYYPEGVEDFPTLVWFHAGGLTGGDRWLPDELKNQGFAVVSASYRLSPNVTSPVYVQDAAAAVAWTFKHIAEFGGDPSKIVVTGHSAGGYLTSMVGMDKRWLAEYGVDADDLAGLAPISGHTVTHFTVRAERGIPGTQVVVDDMAPQFWVRPDSPPVLLVTGDRELELLGRYEENAFFWRMMRVAGHPDCAIIEIEGRDHGGVVAPALGDVLDFARRVCGVEAGGD